MPLARRVARLTLVEADGNVQERPDGMGALGLAALAELAGHLYFRHDILEADVSWFRADGYRVLSFRVTEHSSPEALLVALSERLAFPDYFGRNLDAFNDCLGDVEVSDVGGLLLVLDEYAPFAASFRREAQALLDICADQSRRFLLIGRRFVVLVQSDDPTLVFDPVGASPVMWNPREWLNASRGL